MTYGIVVSRFLGSSGQNIDDLEKYSEAKSKLEFLERTLRWRHLAPTAPNTLGENHFSCYAFIFFLVQAVNDPECVVLVVWPRNCI